MGVDCGHLLSYFVIPLYLLDRVRNFTRSKIYTRDRVTVLKLAFIADIHDNATALEAVLEDIQ